MIDENKLLRIKKLIALSKNPNENEAKAAALKVQELLIQYNLSLSDVQKEEIKEREFKDFKREKKWKTLLMTDVAIAYLCRLMIYDYYTDGYSYVFVGRNCNVEVAKSMYDYLEKTIIRVSREKCKRYKNNLQEIILSLVWLSLFAVNLKKKQNLAYTVKNKKKLKGIWNQMKALALEVSRWI